jgi:hypothetical protein
MPNPPGNRGEAFTLASEPSGADLLRASALSAHHGIGSPEPWVRGFRRPAPFHPDEAGMRAIADALADLVGEGCHGPDR